MHSKRDYLKVCLVFCIVSFFYPTTETHSQVNPQWAYAFGDTSSNSGNSKILKTAEDRDGNIFVTGYFTGTVDLDPSTTTNHNLISKFPGSFFVAKFSSNGNFIWARQFFDTIDGHSQGKDLVIDPDNNIILCGDFKKDLIADISGSDTTWLHNTTNYYNPFIVKYANDGNLLWAYGLSCTNDGDAHLLSMLQNGDFILSSTFTGTIDVDPGPASLNLESNLNRNTYIVKYDNNAHPVWTKCLNGLDNYITANSIDTIGNLVIAGGFFDQMSFPFDPSATTLSTQSPLFDTYIIKYDSNGTFIWARQFSSEASNWTFQINDIKISPDQNIVVSGDIIDTADFDPTADTAWVYPTFDGQSIFIAKYDTLGMLLWVHPIHPVQQLSFIACEALAQDEDGNLYLAGPFGGQYDLDPSNAIHTIYGEGSFIVKYRSDGAFAWEFILEGINFSRIMSHQLMITSDNSLYLSGSLRGTVDFDPNSGTTYLTSPFQNYFAYLVKYYMLPDGIDENINNQNFIIYPNPASENLSIKTEKPVVISVYNQFSQQVIPTHNYSPGDRINLGKLKQGMYFLYIQSLNKEQPKVYKFVKIGSE